MTDRLRAAMRDLAEDAVDNVAPPTGVWQSGQRLRRRSRLLAVGVGVCATVVVVASLVLTRLTLGSGSDAAAPVSVAGDPHLPSRIWAPSPWLHGTNEDGPLGPLALIGVAERRTLWTHGRAVFGVSSRTGQYRFLDLPGLDHESGAVQTGVTTSDGADVPPRVALSPDGTKVAYFYDGEPISDQPLSDVVGFAIYNTVTGDIRRYPVGTSQGLRLLDADGPLWSTDGRYLWVTARIDSKSPVESFVLDTTSGHLRTTIPTPTIGLGGPTFGPWLRVGGSMTLYPQLVDDGVPKYTDFGTFRTSPDGSTIAIGIGRDLYTAPTPNRPSGESNVTKVAPGITLREEYAVLGWSDDMHIVVTLSNKADKISLVTKGIAEVDTTSGDVRAYITGNASAMNTEPQLATDLVGARLTSAERPAAPGDPRPWDAIRGFGAVIVLISVGAAVLWRQRRRRRADVPTTEMD